MISPGLGTAVGVDDGVEVGSSPPLQAASTSTNVRTGRSRAAARPPKPRPHAGPRNATLMQRIIDSTPPHPSRRRLSLLAAVLAAALVLASCDGAAPTPAPTAPTPTATPVPTAELTTPPSPSARAAEPTATAPVPTIAPTPTPTPVHTPTPAPIPVPPADFLPIPKPPHGDPIELAERLKFGGGMKIEPLQRIETELAVGHVEEFHVLDPGALRPFTVEAELRAVSEHAYFFVERGTRVPDSAIAASARELEERIIPAIRRLVNPGWDPGAGLDSRLTILHARIPNVGGYYSLLDTLPRAVNRLSNERPMVYLSLLALQPGNRQYFSVLAHELQHAAQAAADPFEAAWVHEGASEYVASLAGYQGGPEAFYFVPPNTQLTLWPDEFEAAGPHYAAAYSFVRYLGERVGEAAIVSLLSSPLTGVEGVEAFLVEQGIAGGFDEFFYDWTEDNLKAALAVAGGAFGFRLGRSIAGAGEVEAQASQYAADYIRIEPDDRARRLVFQGRAETALLPTTPRSGRMMWWSNRGDAVDATLTRAFDLTGVSQASLAFDLWFDIEEGFDFAYVLASRDGGASWDVLEGRHSTVRDPLDLSFGPAYSAKSGGGRTARWIEEEIDLTGYAGGEVLLRFEYVTDQATHAEGMLIDDLRLEAAGFFDDAESEAGWTAEGFFRTDNRVPQTYGVRLVEFGGGNVVEVPLDDALRGEVSLPANGPGVVVLVAPAAPVTGVPAAYRVAVEYVE